MVKGGRELGVLRDNLEWIIRYAEGIEEYRTYFGDDFETFADTEVYQDACYSKINQITQCLDRVASKYPELYSQNFSMLVGSIKGVRNIISHQYENVDVRIVWDEFVLKNICHLVRHHNGKASDCLLTGKIFTLIEFPNHQMSPVD